MNRVRPWLPAIVSVSVVGSIVGLGQLAGAPTKPRVLPRPADVAYLSYEIVDASTGEPMPGKITIVPSKGGQPLMLGSGDLPRQDVGGLAAYDRIFSLQGVGTSTVPPGTYDVYVSRGPEWTLHVERGVVIGRKGVEIRATLRHVVDTAGWLSGDFHVHSAASPDSRVPMVARVYEFAAEGVELIVSTDHNVVADYAPIIGELGASPILASLRGDELTTGDWGHYGAFPLPQVLAAAGHGAIPIHGKSPIEIFAQTRREAPEAVIDVHHPRLDDEIGYFQRAGFDARTGKATRKGFSMDFDAMEILNGYQDPDRKSVDRLILDWFALLDHGVIVTATGNSDTHHLDYNLGGYPRNYVRVADDRPPGLTPIELATAVKKHRAFLTTGPFVRVRVRGSEIGDLAAAPGGKATVRVTVQAAPWIDVDSVMLYLDGKEHQRWPVAATAAVVRLDTEVELAVTRDAYVVVRVDGNDPLLPVVGEPKRFTVRPFALTNPVFLDGDGDGRFSAATGYR